MSHSLISVAIGATTVALGYWLVTRQRGDAVVLWLLYASHWAADFITGSKPTWPGGPTVGLVLYDRALWDCVLECLVIVGCWSVYRRSFSERAKRSALMVVHAARLDCAAGRLRGDSESGYPDRVARDAVTLQFSGSVRLVVIRPCRMPLATRARIFYASRAWRMMEVPADC